MIEAITHSKIFTNLFQHEHGVVEQLLQFFVRHVDTKLLKAIQLFASK